MTSTDHAPGTLDFPESSALYAPRTSESGPSRGDHPRSLADAVAAAWACDDYRGQNTLILDLTQITPICDYFVITTATNRRQLHAIADEVDRRLRETGARRMGREGYESSTWVVQDYGDVVLHVFTPETREFYDLENLWGDAPHVDWQAG